MTRSFPGEASAAPGCLPAVKAVCLPDQRVLREHDAPLTITVPPSASSGARPAPPPPHGALWLPIFLLPDNETQEPVLVSIQARLPAQSVGLRASGGELRTPFRA